MLPRWLAGALWALLLGVSTLLSAHLVADYGRSVLGLHLKAQWQFEFLATPILSIVAAILSYALCHFTRPTLAKACVRLSILGVALPATLTLLVLFRIY